MKTFNEFITELLDSSFEFAGPKKSTIFRDAWEYNFTTNDDKKVGVYFEDHKSDTWTILFDVNGKISKTDAGGAIPIFATVTKVIQDFIKKFQPKILRFSASKFEPSRVSLYRTFVKRFAKQFNFKYEEENKPDGIYFIITL